MGNFGFDEDAIIEVSKIEHDDLSVAPNSPPSGQLAHYAKSGRFYQKTAAGVEKVVGPQVAVEVDVDSSVSANTILGSTVQDWINRLWGPTNSQKVTYLGNGDIDFVEIFSSPSQVEGNRKGKIALSYSSDNVSGEVITLYDNNGTSILKTITLTHTYSGDDYQTTTTVVA